MSYLYYFALDPHSKWFEPSQESHAGWSSTDFSSSFCDKMFQDAGRLFFLRDAALRNAAYLSSA